MIDAALRAALLRVLGRRLPRAQIRVPRRLDMLVAVVLVVGPLAIEIAAGRFGRRSES